MCMDHLWQKLMFIIHNAWRESKRLVTSLLRMVVCLYEVLRHNHFNIYTMAFNALLLVMM